jgi:UDP-glucose 4-epimerase
VPSRRGRGRRKLSSSLSVLLTGGAGYIGSHIGLHLAAAGHDVVSFDDLSSGNAWAVKAGELVQGDVTDPAALEQLFAARRFDAVVHLAALSSVEDSAARPEDYYRVNVCGTLALLQRCRQAGVRALVFSSSAAVYGAPERLPVEESAALAPISPYGASKAMAERIISDVGAAAGLATLSLRYFNVAGADPLGRVGESTPEPWHLITVACEAALGQRPGLTIYGNDYDTPDGTCIRDYVHVDDVAAAHLAALDYLLAGGASQVLNCGYGEGASVRQVVNAVKRLAASNFPVNTAARRPGDPPVLVAKAERIGRLLDWRPRFADLDAIVGSALDWERRRENHPPGPPPGPPVAD